MKKTVLISALFCLLLSFAGCGAGAADTESGGNGVPEPSAQQSREREASVKNGQATEFHKYPGLSHGFGLGTGTAAEGWLKEAAAFWEKQTN